MATCKQLLAETAKNAKSDVEFNKHYGRIIGVLVATVNYMPVHPSKFQGQALVGTMDNHEVVVFTDRDALTGA